ncbi:hypothetical protein JTB14_007157 [Gonioctena quinquepunctata]|nr:hypothetical protein JTB14_007157 [Gonioctena quinquepunctata]
MGTARSYEFPFEASFGSEDFQGFGQLGLSEKFAQFTKVISSTYVICGIVAVDTAGIPLRDMKRFKVKRNASVDKAETNSKCTALVAIHTKTAMCI